MSSYLLNFAKFFTDIDECAASPCSETRACLNLRGGYVCLPQMEVVTAPELLNSTLGGESMQVSVSFESSFNLTLDGAIRINGMYRLVVVGREQDDASIDFVAVFGDMSIARDEADETLLHINFTAPAGNFLTCDAYIHKKYVLYIYIVLYI